MKIALLEDYDARPLVHQAIADAIERPARALATAVVSIGMHSSGDNPDTSMPSISALVCELAGQTDTISLDRGARIAEDCHCGYGVNPDYLSLFANSEFRFRARDNDGDRRAYELSANRLLFETACQPERSPLHTITHPRITAMPMESFGSW